MSMAVNAVYNRMQIHQAQVQRPKSKGSDITQAVKGAVDLSNADYYDTFACGIYLKEKGQIQYIGDILLPYELAEEEQQEGYWDGKVDSFAKYDVLKALDNFIKESFETGRYKQYMEFKHLQEAIEKYLPASVNKVKDHNDF